SKKEEDPNKPDGSKKEEDLNKPDGSKKEENPNKPDGSKKEEEKNKNNDSGGKDSQKKSPRENKNKKLSENNSLKDRLKNGAKNRAKNAVNNNKAGQTVNDLKDKTEKIKKAANVAKKAAKATAKALKITAKAISAIVKVAMAAWPVTLTIIIIIIICAAFTALTPGLHGDVKENTDSYSKTDRKTLEKLKALFNKYPKADGALAIATVIYPYYDMLWDQEVGSMVLNPSDSNKEESTLEDPEEDLEEIKEEKDEQVDDVYLELFRKWQYRSRLKTLLKKFDAEGEEAYFSYLKTSYFNGNGYDDLINKVKDDKKEDLKNRIIENLKNIKGNFLNYVSENVSCSVSLTSVGTAEIDSMLKSSVFVDVKERSCKTGTKTGINACKSMYEAPISLKNYVMGVTYQEIGVNENTSIEKVKAQMIAAKGFAVSRYKIMGWGLQQTAEGAYVIPIRSNTNDQDYCDLDTGCMDNPSGNHRGPVSTMVRQMLDQAWNETVNDYVYDKDKAITVGAYKNKHDDSCLLGSCLAQTELDQNVENKMTYMEILASQYKNYAMVNIETGNLSVPGEKVCTESGNTNDSRQKVVNTAMGVIGKIPYYFGGKPDVAEYEGNAFGTVLTIPDSGGRLLKGLDCSGFVNWVFWTTMNDNLGNGSTNDLLAISEEIVYEDLKPGDLGFINDGSDGDNHVGIYAGENKWIHETGGEINNVTYGTYTGFKLYKRLNILKSNDFSGWTVREKTPTSDELFEKGNTTNRGQCVWYAKNRAKEIMGSLYTSGDMDKAMYDKLYQKVDISYGNGGDWFDRYKEIYKSSSNVEDAKPGSFITWGSAGCYGHIAVVEQVNKEKNEIVITEGYAKGGSSCPGDWNCVKFKKFNREMKTNALKYRATCGNGGGKVDLNFQGYLYFLEE
ncbi:MAG: CHAP domain-containing protein, partial [Bacilli bacterium]